MAIEPPPKMVQGHASVTYVTVSRSRGLKLTPIPFSSVTPGEPFREGVRRPPDNYTDVNLRQFARPRCAGCLPTDSSHTSWRTESVNYYIINFRYRI